MSFKVVGKGSFTREGLFKLLEGLGISNPHSVVEEAEGGRVLCEGYRILAVRQVY